MRRVAFRKRLIGIPTQKGADAKKDQETGRAGKRSQKESQDQWRRNHTKRDTGTGESQYDLDERSDLWIRSIKML